jgi:hypothetical protein
VSSHIVAGVPRIVTGCYDSRWVQGCRAEEARGRARRRLAAILVAGLSRLFPGDEKQRFAGLRKFLSEIIEPMVPEFGGNIFKQTSDLVLIEFDSVVEASRCELLCAMGSAKEPNLA